MSFNITWSTMTVLGEVVKGVWHTLSQLGPLLSSLHKVEGWLYREAGCRPHSLCLASHSGAENIVASPAGRCQKRPWWPELIVVLEGRHEPPISRLASVLVLQCISAKQTATTHTYPSVYQKSKDTESGKSVTLISTKQIYEKKQSLPEAIWILQPDSAWIREICSPPLPITATKWAGSECNPLSTLNHAWISLINPANIYALLIVHYELTCGAHLNS